jgi:L-lactate dehydrogenase
MKIGIIGTGAVGAACALSVIQRGCARELVLWDRTRQRAKAVATDMRYGAPLLPAINIRDGDFEDLAGAALVMITAGINEKTGGATNRADPVGRLRLLQTNARVYEEIVPQLVKVAPQAVILVVTDPPDPLADLARNLAGHDSVLSTGTFLDSLRFRVHLAQELGVAAASVEAYVVGEHGMSAVFLWYSARVGGTPIRDVLGTRREEFDAFRLRIENDVRYANIAIIEGNQASQYGIGMVSARIAEAVIRDEQAVIPIGSYNPKLGVTLSLPSIVGRPGVREILDPETTEEERQALRHSAETLSHALEQITAGRKKPAA